VSHRRPEPIEVDDYDGSWPEEYERLRARVVDVLGEVVLRVEHVGSTAVPGLAAKPIVDLYAVVADLELAAERLVTLGYVPEGELGVPGRLGFAWPAEEKRHHLYICSADHAGLEPVVRFRDHLRANPDEVLAYAELKRELAGRHRNDRDAYAAGKGRFIEAALERSAVKA
jgi:GrpB-like predicted nucleotidyltransferase (UPF0157 family)